eukprot:jgi/Bigna1/90476/estExt_fgenesh1_pg.C_710060
MGTFLGHFVPGICLGSFGIYHFMLEMISMIHGSGPDEETGGMDWLFTRDTSVVAITAILGATLTLYEIPNVTNRVPFVNENRSESIEDGALHALLFFGFTLFAMASLAVRYELLPRSSGTTVFSLSQCLGGFIWVIHAKHKITEAARLAHYIIAGIFFLCGILGASTLISSSRTLIIWTLFVFCSEGLWLALIGALLFDSKHPLKLGVDKSVTDWQVMVAFVIGTYLMFILLGTIYFLLRCAIRRNRQMTIRDVDSYESDEIPMADVLNSISSDIEKKQGSSTFSFLNAAAPIEDDDLEDV